MLARSPGSPYLPAVHTRETEITLSAMRFHARIGVLPHEREIEQPVEIDLTVWVGGRTAAGEVLDYRVLYGLASAAFEGGHVEFLEDVAEDVAQRALDVPRVSRARVAVRKPHVALAGPLGYAQVLVDRGRESR